MRACVHEYTGEGKGKTTAAVGLSIRFCGKGGKVLFTQFMKDGSSGEIKMMETIPGLEVFSCTESLGFIGAMSERELERAKEMYRSYFMQITEKVKSGEYGLLVLDEVNTAAYYDLISGDEVISFLESRPEGLEVVMTGRYAPEELLGAADYITNMTKKRHPFDTGMAARHGIEY